MEKSQADWLREYMRVHIANSGVVEAKESNEKPGRPPDSETKLGAEALYIVNQAAEFIAEIDRFAAEKQARAETLANQAIQRLEIADGRVRSAESARLAAKAEINELSDKLQQALTAMEQMASRLADTEAKLSAAEQRTRYAETRASDAEKALKQVEEVVRNRILPRLPSDFGGDASAAA
jgi:chromosome segregation ATPase